jgi:hypothetical protein
VREYASQPKVKKNRHNTHAGEFKLLSEHLTREDEELLENIMPRFELPSSLKKFERASLPLSLMPPTFKDFLDYRINSWKECE